MVERREGANEFLAEIHGQHSLARAAGSLLLRCRNTSTSTFLLSSSPLHNLLHLHCPQSFIGRGSIFLLMLNLLVFKSYFYINLFFAINRLKTHTKHPIAQISSTFNKPAAEDIQV